MRMVWLLSAVIMLATNTLGQSNPLRVEKAFQSSGQIRMQLGGGDYEVRAGSADRIVIDWTVKNDAAAKKVKTKINIVGSSAKIKTSGPHGHSHAVIEVPAESNLIIRHMAGDMSVRGIIGNKDVSSHAGRSRYLCRQRQRLQPRGRFSALRGSKCQRVRNFQGWNLPLLSPSRRR